MELELEKQPSGYRFGSFSTHGVQIDNKIYTTSLIIMPDILIPDWSPIAIEQLTSLHLSTILDLQPELILLGTGYSQQFVRPDVLKDLPGRNIGIDIMSSRAACRTYNILASEGRRVAAGIINDSRAFS